MSTVLKFPLRDLSLRQARQEFGLSLTQAASALGISASTLDGWEQGRKAQATAQRAAAAYAVYVQDTKDIQRAEKNLLFGCFPMRVARDILERDIEGIASDFHMSPSNWIKIEANARAAPEAVVEELERRISARMATLCDWPS